MSDKRLPKPRVSDPIIFRAQANGPEHVARPCCMKHRTYWLSGYLILSCKKCDIKPLTEEAVSA